MSKLRIPVDLAKDVFLGRRCQAFGHDPRTQAPDPCSIQALLASGKDRFFMRTRQRASPGQANDLMSRTRPVLHTRGRIHDCSRARPSSDAIVSTWTIGRSPYTQVRPTS